MVFFSSIKLPSVFLATEMPLEIAIVCAWDLSNSTVYGLVNAFPEVSSRALYNHLT